MNSNRKQALNEDFVLNNSMWLTIDDKGYWAAPLARYKDYWVTSCGEVISMKKKPIKLKQSDNGSGYLFCMLYVDGKYNKEYVHRLVVETFLEDGGEDRNCHPRNQVNHLNGDKSNNKLSNLERCSRSENMLHLNKVLKSI